MKFTLEVGKRSAKDAVKEKKKVKKLKVQYLRKVARRRRRLDYLRVLYYKRKYDKRFRFEEPRFREVVEELNNTYKLFAFCLTFFTVRTDQNQPREVRPLDVLLVERNITDKELIYFMCSCMHRNKQRVHWFVAGYKNGYMLPMCAVVQKYVTITMGLTYKVHIGDQFDIMKDYYKDANSWKVMSWDGSKILMSYIEGRSETGSPDLIIYDEKYWDKHQPLATTLMKQMKVFSSGTERELYSKGY